MIPTPDKSFAGPAVHPPEGSAPKTTLMMAEGGHAEAQFSLGLQFAAEGAKQDYAQAARWYLKAAGQDHALAQFNLSIMHERGQGGPCDEETSLRWLRKAAHLGDAGAQYALGRRQHRMSKDGGPEAVRESRIEAYKWMRLAAAQGYGASPASCDLETPGMAREDVVEGQRRATAFVAGKPGS